MAEPSMLAIVERYERGELSRDDFWRQMQRFHLGLRDYQALLARRDIAALEIRPDGLVMALPNGLRFAWNPEDIRTAPNIVLNQGAYEADELIGMRRIARESRHVLDIGANIGWYALHLAPLLKPGGRVWAFEPVPATYAQLERNIGLNDAASTVVPFNMALGEAPGEARFFIPAFSGSVAASQRALFPDDAQREVTCRVGTLDAFVTEHGLSGIDFVKCDIEGSELFALRGGLATLERERPVLFVEMLRKWAQAFDYHPDDIIALLATLGYACWGYVEGQLVRFAHIDEACRQTNFIFLHEEKHGRMRALLAAPPSAEEARP